MHVSTDLFDVPRCRERIAGMQDEELDEYILHIKTRLVNSHENSYSSKNLCLFSAEKRAKSGNDGNRGV